MSKTAGRQTEQLDQAVCRERHLPLVEDFVQAILADRPPACPLAEAPRPICCWMPSTGRQPMGATSPYQTETRRPPMRFAPRPENDFAEYIRTSTANAATALSGSRL